MALIKPRLTDYHNINIPQSEVDFAIPFFDEDIPLYVDPFLLWKSPSQQDQALHITIVNALNNIGNLFKAGKETEAISQLIISSECNEVGLGQSTSRTGKRIGSAKAKEILNIFDKIPHYQNNNFQHLEEIQFYVDGFSKDRISDFSCNFLKSFLIDFTIDECKKLKIPTQQCTIENIYDLSSSQFIDRDKVDLPYNPENNEPIILTPKRWLRHTPWLNFDDYFKSYCPKDEIVNPNQKLERVSVLNYNRDNYGVIDDYVKAKERDAQDCKNDPLFNQIPVSSAKRKMKEVKKLNSGKSDNADIKYENLVCQLMASMMYPELDFAAEQSRTDEGVQIRDLIFYNNRENEFLADIFEKYSSSQIVMEIKNVKEINSQHINQLNRYMTDSLGKFGVLITRNPLTKAMQKNIIALWSGQRRSIIVLTDADLEQMAEVFESKQRKPIDVLKKKYTEFRRDCPS